MEDILTATDFESENSQYIFYRNDKDEVLGIWFYDTKESEKIFKLLTKMSLTYKMGDTPAGAGLPKDLLTLASASSTSTRARSATTGSSDGRHSSRSAAAEEISDLLGMLGTHDTAKSEGAKLDVAATATPSSMEQNGRSNANGGKAKKAKEERNKDKERKLPPTKTGLGNFTKSQLKLALERVVRKDEFIDMLYTEIVHAANS